MLPVISEAPVLNEMGVRGARGGGADAGRRGDGEDALEGEVDLLWLSICSHPMWYYHKENE